MTKVFNFLDTVCKFRENEMLKSRKKLKLDDKVTSDEDNENNHIKRNFLKWWEKWFGTKKL